MECTNCSCCGFLYLCHLLNLLLESDEKHLWILALADVCSGFSTPSRKFCSWTGLPFCSFALFFALFFFFIDALNVRSYWSLDICCLLYFQYGFAGIKTSKGDIMILAFSSIRMSSVFNFRVIVCGLQKFRWWLNDRVTDDRVTDDRVRNSTSLFPPDGQLDFCSQCGVSLNTPFWVGGMWYFLWLRTGKYTILFWSTECEPWSQCQLLTTPHRPSLIKDIEYLTSKFRE